MVSKYASYVAGALGLEPRAYGFGDEADKSASVGTTFEVNISTIQKQIAAAFEKTDQKRNKLGISATSLRSSGATVYFAETVGSEIISYPSDFSNNQGAFSCFFWLKSQSITLRYQLSSTIQENHQLWGKYHQLLLSFVSAINVIKEVLEVFNSARR